MTSYNHVDCVAEILSKINLRERQTLRLVSKAWAEAVHELDRTQKCLTIIGRCPLKRPDGDNSSNQVINWPGHYMRYTCLEAILARFRALRSLTFECIDPWNDRRLLELTQQCSRLQCLSFVRCFDLGRSRAAGISELNVSTVGWHRLIEAYGEQVTDLTLHDCDLDDNHLALVVIGFRRLRYLDIGGNRLVTSAALAQLCPSIEVLKVGSKLTGPSAHPMGVVPIEQIVAGQGRYLRELHVQGFLDAQLARLADMPHLTKLVLRFVRPAFDDPTTCGQHLAFLGRCHRLTTLEVYQHNAHDSSMALGGTTLSSIFNGCSALEKLVINCDIWCESPFDDNLLEAMVDACPHLMSVDLCPGNFTTTDKSLRSLARLLRLRHLRLVEFNGITGDGLVELVMTCCSTLRKLVIEDCCDLDTARFIDQLRAIYHQGRLSNCLDILIAPLRALETPSEVVQLGRNVTITITGKRDRFRQGDSVHKGHALFSFRSPKNATEVYHWLTDCAGQIVNGTRHWLGLTIALLTILAYLGYGLTVLATESVGDCLKELAGWKRLPTGTKLRRHLRAPTSWAVLGIACIACSVVHIFFTR